MKTFVWALIIFAVLNIAGLLVRSANGLGVVLHALSPGVFGIAALATACGITENKPVLIAMVVLLLLVKYPCTLPDLAVAMTPVGVGLLFGTGVRAAMKKGVRDEA